MIAHAFLWKYYTSADIATRFRQCERYSRGHHLWKWVKNIAALKGEVIVWDELFDSDHSEIFIVSVDGTDFKIREKSTNELNVDKKQYSQKFNHGGLKYEIAVGLVNGKAVWTSGPHRGGRNDQEIFDEAGGLAQKIKDGKLAISDGGYSGKKVCPPNTRDPKPVRRFKGRVRARHETFNGRLKNYSILQNMFRHDPKKHGLVFDAVAVTINMQIDAGSSLFAL